MKRLHAIVKGDVQGVGYRYFVLYEAERLNLRGFVKNLYNGDVEVEAEGDEESLKKLLQSLWKGPRLSQVEDVEIKWEDDQPKYSLFDIHF